MVDLCNSFIRSMRKCTHADIQKKLAQLAKVRFIKCCLLPPMMRGVVVYTTSNGIRPLAKNICSMRVKRCINTNTLTDLIRLMCYATVGYPPLWHSIYDRPKLLNHDALRLYVILMVLFSQTDRLN